MRSSWHFGGATSWVDSISIVIPNSQPLVRKTTDLHQVGLGRSAALLG